VPTGFQITSVYFISVAVPDIAISRLAAADLGHGRDWGIVKLLFAWYNGGKEQNTLPAASMQGIG